jgi:hypothetical protein
VLPVALAAERFGVPNTIFVACLIMLGIVGLFYALSPTLRKLDATMSEQYRQEHS